MAVGVPLVVSRNPNPSVLLLGYAGEVYDSDDDEELASNMVLLRRMPSSAKNKSASLEICRDPQLGRRKVSISSIVDSLVAKEPVVPRSSSVSLEPYAIANSKTNQGKGECKSPLSALVMLV